MLQGLDVMQFKKLKKRTRSFHGITLSPSWDFKAMDTTECTSGELCLHQTKLYSRVCCVPHLISSMFSSEIMWKLKPICCLHFQSNFCCVIYLQNSTFNHAYDKNLKIWFVKQIVTAFQFSRFTIPVPPRGCACQFRMCRQNHYTQRSFFTSETNELSTATGIIMK